MTICCTRIEREHIVLYTMDNWGDEVSVAMFPRIGLLVAVLAVVACSNPSHSSESAQDIPVATATVHVGLDGVIVQTLTPNLSAIIDIYEVTLSRGGQNPRTAFGPTGPFEFNGLPVGTWDVTVDSLDSSNAVVATGSTSIDVTVDRDNSAVVSVAPSQNGTGHVDVTISWPTGAVDAIDSATLTSQDGSEADIADMFSLTDSEANYSGEHESGNYELNVCLSSGGQCNVTTIEAVQIYDNLATTGTIALDSSEIGHAPAAPSDLVAVAIDSSTVDLSWTDNSHVEEGVSVERSDDGGTTYSAIQELHANTEQYQDAGLSPETTYFYRIVAYNDFGNSSASLEANVTTPNEAGDPSHTIVVDFQNPEDPDISFSGTANEVLRGESLNISASSGYSSYEWYLDGSTTVSALSSNGADATIDTTTLAFGVHTVSVVVDESYSAQFTFLVVNAVSSD